MPAPTVLARLRAVCAALLVACVAGALLPGVAGAAGAVKVVRYHGLALRVPASWPVYRLSASPARCVRFDRHALYLGAPSAAQRCPAVAAGRTEAILVSPLRAASVRILRVPTRAAARGPSGAAQLVEASHGVVITATWSRDPRLVRRALGVRSLALARSAAARAPAPAASAARRLRVRPAVATAHAASVSTPGQIYTGLGFDVCSTPSPAQMAAWGASPYRAIGVYIGGANMACSQPNLSATWVAQQGAAGWHLIPIYVGLQAPGNSCGCAPISGSQASAQGAAAAQDAVTQAESVGLGPGNPIYDDMEGYARGGSQSSAVLAFLAAWTSELHALGYKSGVYSSSASGIADLVSRYGTGFAEPDELWIANWNGQANTYDPVVPASDWAIHQRLHQFDGSHNETYGGVRLNIDGDYVDAATAASGAGSVFPAVAATPSVSVRPAADGSVNLYPSWNGEPGIGTWQVLGGWSQDSVAPVTAVRARHRGPVVVRAGYRWYAVQAVSPGGTVLGISSTVPTPWHAAIFGRSVFVSRSGIAGVPVGCYFDAPCGVEIKAWIGRRTLGVGFGTVPFGGGLVYLKLYPGARRILARAHGNRLLARVGVFGTGIRLSRRLTLIGFTTSGRRPYLRPARSRSLQSVGLTDFVLGGGGGILVACTDSGPCRVKATLFARGRPVGTSTPQWLGPGELGYVFFHLTATGRQMLARAPGNQLGVKAQLSNSGATRANPSGHLALVGYR